MDLGTPLFDVTFVVVDLETTGCAPGVDAITEIGALKLRGGELLGALETLVNPGVPIPPMITVLTGITEAMVFPAPRIDAVAPAVPGVRGRRRGRRSQHSLRRVVPRRRAGRARLSASAEPSRRHDRARPATDARRRAEPSPRHAGPPLPYDGRARAPRVRRRGRDRRGLHALLEHAGDLRRLRPRRSPGRPEDARRTLRRRSSR